MTCLTEQGNLNGCAGQVQKFELADPRDASRVHQGGPNRHRLIVANGRGRFAAGVPRVLGLDRPALAAVPLDAPLASETHAREIDLGRVRSQLRDGSAIVSLCGQGGVGKTLLAADVVHDADCRRQFADGVIWLHVGQRGSDRLDSLMGRVIADVQTRLLGPRFDSRPPPSDWKRAKEWLANTLRSRRLRCLLVLDDVWSSEVATVFAGVESIALLITTRQCEVAESAALLMPGSCAPPIHIDCVEPRSQMAKEIFATAAKLAVLDVPSSADEVLDACAGLPMALAMAGAMCASQPSSSEACSKLAADHREARLAERLLQGPFYAADKHADAHHQSLSAVISLSVTRLPPKAQALFPALALTPQRLPLERSLLAQLWDLDSSETESVVEELRSHSLLSSRADGSCLLHDLTHAYLQQRGPPAWALGRFTTHLTSAGTLDRLAAERHAAGRPILYQLLACILEAERMGWHAAQGYTRIGEEEEKAAAKAAERGETPTAGDGKLVERLEAASDLLKHLSGRVNFEGSVKLLRRAVAIEEQLEGTRSGQGGRSRLPGLLNSLGSALRVLAEQAELLRAELLEEAMRSLERGLGIRRMELGGTDNTKCASAMSKMAAVLKMQVKLDDAAKLLEKAAKIEKNELGADSPTLALTLYHLGGVLEEQGRLVESLEQYRNAVLIAKQSLGTEHVDYARYQVGTARVLQRMGKDDDALDLYTRALHIYQKWFGPSHCHTMTCRQRIIDLAGASEYQAGTSPRAEDLPAAAQRIALSLQGSLSMLSARAGACSVAVSCGDMAAVAAYRAEIANTLQQLQLFEAACG